MNKFMIVTDFDGTIVTEDLSVLILDKFASDWKKYDTLLEQGTIDLEECMVRQFGQIRATQQEIIRFIKDKSILREGFVDFYKFCRQNSLNILVVSASMGFVVKSVLEDHKLTLEIIAADVEFKDGVELKPPITDSEYPDFKSSIVAEYQEQGFKVIYVGDGLSDLNGAKQADVVFTVEGRSLSNSLLGDSFTIFNDFRQILYEIKEMITT